MKAHTTTPLIWCGYVCDGTTIKYIDNGKTYDNAQAMSHKDALAMYKSNQ